MTSHSDLKKDKQLPRQLTLSFFDFSQPFLNKISIKKLTLIGFAFVVIPLVMALIFGANKASELAKKSTNAIYNVAQLTQLNSKLDDTIAKLERSASQFVVLKDDELLAVFSSHHKALKDIIQETSAKQQDKVLKKQLTSLQSESDRIKELMLNESIDAFSLEQIQQEFKPLQLINEQLEKRSAFAVNQQVLDIQQTTEEISDNILERLYIIPITLLIAGVFIILITKPLKRLTDKIQLLQTDPLSEQFKERELAIWIEDQNGNVVCNKQTITFNSSSDKVEDRKRNVVISLKGSGFERTSTYKLVFKDAEKNDHYASHSVIIDLAIEDDFF